MAGEGDLWDLVKPQGATATADLWDLVKPPAKAKIPREFDESYSRGALNSAFAPEPTAEEASAGVERIRANAATPGRVAGRAGSIALESAGNLAGSAANSVANLPFLPSELAGAGGAFIGRVTGNKAIEQGSKDFLNTVRGVKEESDIPTDPEDPATAIGGGLGLMGAAAASGGLAPAAVIFGASNGVALHQRVLEETGDPVKAMAGLIGGGVAGGGLALLPAARVLARINGQSGGVLVRAFGDVGADAGSGFLYGSGQSAINDTIEKYATGKDIPILENALKNGGLGTAMSLIATGLGSAAAKVGGKGKPTEAPPVEQSGKPEELETAPPGGGVGVEGAVPGEKLPESEPRAVDAPAPLEQPAQVPGGNESPASGAASSASEGAAPIHKDLFSIPLHEAEAATKARHQDLIKPRTADELETEIASRKQRTKEQEDLILKDRADEWRRAHRRGNTAKVDEIEAGLSQRQVDALYGVGDREAAHEDLQGILNEVRAIEAFADRPDILVGEAARAIRKLGVLGDNPAEWASREPEAFARMQTIQRVIGEQGYDPVKFSNDVLNEAGRAYSDKYDAADILEPFTRQARKPPPRMELPVHEAPKEPKAKIPLRLAEPKPEPAPERLPVEPRVEPRVEARVEAREALPVTSIKNRTVDAELEAMGFPPARHGEGSDFETVWQKAKDIVAKDAHAGTKLVDELSEKARPPTREENAVLAHELNRRINERDAAELAFKADPTEDARARVDRARADYAKAADAVTLAGTESSGSLNFRRMMVARDYSLAAMERAADVASGGKASPERQAKVASLHEQLAELDRAIAVRENKIAEIEQREALKREVRARRPKGAAAVEEFLAPKAEAALKRLASKARSGIGGEDIADAAIVGAHLIAKGAAHFEAWSAQMVETIGEWVRPHLRAIYEQSRDLHEASPKEASKLKGQKTRERNIIAKTEEKIALKDFAPEPKRVPLEPDAELLDLRTKRNQIVRQYKQDLFEYEREHRTGGKKTLDALREARGLIGNVMTSFDFSAVLRQGAFYTLAHPVRAARNVALAARAAKSQDFYDRLNTAFQSRQNYEAGRRAGLELTDVSDVLTPPEEMLRSRIANRIPGIKHSNRAFTAYMNLQRVQAFDALYDGYAGKMTSEVAKEIATKVNTATGRGNIRGWESVIRAGSEVLFAPKLYISRFKLLTGEPMWRGDPSVRKAFAADYARFIGAIGAIYTLNWLAGGQKPETDPRSSDFGKLRFGNSRVDITGGLNQYTVLLSQLTSGQRKTLAGGRVEEANRGDTLAKFLRSKLSPVIGSGVDVLQTKNVVGEDVTPLDAARRLVTPLQFSDIYDAMKEHGAAEGGALALLGFFGAGLQTFEPGFGAILSQIEGESQAAQSGEEFDATALAYKGAANKTRSTAQKLRAAGLKDEADKVEADFVRMFNARNKLPVNVRKGD